MAAEKWVEGGVAQYRTNTYLYAANGVDFLAWTNAGGVLPAKQCMLVQK